MIYIHLCLILGRNKYLKINNSTPAKFIIYGELPCSVRVLCMANPGFPRLREEGGCQPQSGFTVLFVLK